MKVWRGWREREDESELPRVRGGWTEALRRKREDFEAE
jgi:hypothetical protein